VEPSSSRHNRAISRLDRLPGKLRNFQSTESGWIAVAPVCRVAEIAIDPCNLGADAFVMGV
jgi:hypothetical protein